MPHRDNYSPTASENEIDITRNLLDDDDISVSSHAVANPGASHSLHPDRKARIQAAENIFDFEAGDGAEPDDVDEDDDDAVFIAERQAISNRKAANLKGPKSAKKGGGFQTMGLNTNLLKAITRKGYTMPTPIQRKTIPMILEGRDVVGMARTGSGKTAAFILPMLDKLKIHSVKVGARALIMSPSRELALQTLKVVKEFGKGTDLKSVLLVGGDSLEEQFGLMSGNPDIVIATPGRFLHLKVEMGLDLASIRYVVFDEADRLFEMGFAAQLTEILHALPQPRQTLLFSATLPKSLVEFARAGLQEPLLIRLDAESKISPDLESAFFSVKSAEKEGALLHLLAEVIKIPTGPTGTALRTNDREKAPENKKKRKRGDVDRVKPNESPTVHSTIIFAATKHHVDYIAALLRRSGYAVSHAYGSLDQTARKIQVQEFRTGITHVLVVTDVAARGIDIPVLANVINYDFPAQPKIFVHRVGRTARAGQRGWSYSLVQESDAPYLLDLQLFLGRRLVLGRDSGHDLNYSEDVVIGALQRDHVERSCELVGKTLDEDSDLYALRSVAIKGERLYLKTRNSASSESARRYKDLINENGWTALHPLFSDECEVTEIEREKMLARVSGFRPSETVFEIGKRGQDDETVDVMRKRRSFIEAKRRKKNALENQDGKKVEEAEYQAIDDENEATRIAPKTMSESLSDFGSASEDEQDVIISQAVSGKSERTREDWKDAEFFMSYTSTNTNAAEDRGYGVHSGSYNTASQNSNFVEAARGATMDLKNDDGVKALADSGRSRGMRWDRKSKKYVSRANDEDGSKGSKMIRSESGQKIAASFRSGRFDAWRKSNKIDRLPRTGNVEATPSVVQRSLAGSRYRHKAEKAPKEADKFRDDYWKRKKKVEMAKEKRLGRFKDGKGTVEIKGVDDVTRARGIKAKRREKNARPGRKKNR